MSWNCPHDGSGAPSCAACVADHEAQVVAGFPGDQNLNAPPPPDDPKHFRWELDMVAMALSDAGQSPSTRDQFLAAFRALLGDNGWAWTEAGFDKALAEATHLAEGLPPGLYGW